jgi:hypothetical protein
VLSAAEDENGDSEQDGNGGQCYQYDEQVPDRAPPAPHRDFNGWRLRGRIASTSVVSLREGSLAHIVENALVLLEPDELAVDLCHRIVGVEYDDVLWPVDDLIMIPRHPLTSTSKESTA